ncbi:hypothetical protein [Chromatium okenii]|jgi:hypothetical protein|uniref:hypothetical protein n=1 Tax=Chromatium okenii TaxID=61644 RepID=UPI0026EA15D0|nr:hypothetical protein [Chromatium okenii]MBV5311041.1 hypothetical protein [Chromatium okenii]
MSIIFYKKGNDYPHIHRHQMQDEKAINNHCANFYPEDRYDEWLRIQKVLNPPLETPERLAEIFLRKGYLIFIV